MVQWVSAVMCLSVQMFKLPNIWMFQTSAKSLPNLENCDFFVEIWKKVDMSGQAVSVQISFLLRRPLNFQIFKYIAYMF